MSRRAILVMCLAVSAVELALDWLHPQVLRFSLRAVFEATMITINMLIVLQKVQQRTASEAAETAARREKQRTLVNLASAIAPLLARSNNPQSGASVQDLPTVRQSAEAARAVSDQYRPLQESPPQ